MNNSVFVDANVLLESFLKDRKGAEKAQKYIASHDVVISPLTAHLFVYFGQKDGISLEVLLGLLKSHRVTDCGNAEVMWAVHNIQGNDFEDALQVACAVVNNCKTFVTFDKNLANRYKKFILMKLL